MRRKVVLEEWDKDDGKKGNRASQSDPKPVTVSSSCPLELKRELSDVFSSRFEAISLRTELCTTVLFVELQTVWRYKTGGT